jgi:hypothetical protein
MLIRTFILIAFFVVAATTYGQVDKIKEASEAHSEDSSVPASNYDSSNSGGGILSDIFLFLPHWQAYKLHDDRQRYQPMISLDVMLQGNYKPADTYIFWPRIRANWGLFSTDFRMNYMLEKNDAGGFNSLRTNDWQVLQFNLITSRFITARVGAGTMVEMFGGKQAYTELTVGFGIHAPDHSNAFFLEYRDAYKSGADYNARIEFSGQYYHEIFRTGILHGYLTVGAMYQKYYGTIDFWGVSGGVVFRLF